VNNQLGGTAVKNLGGGNKNFGDSTRENPHHYLSNKEIKQEI